MSLLRPRSVRGRLRLALAVLLPLSLGLTALVLDRAFERSQRSAMAERLRLQAYVLIGAAEAGGGQLWMPPQLQEPRFDQPGSGLYGLIEDGDGRLLWRSRSATGRSFSIPPADGPRLGETDHHFYYAFPVTWETEDGRETRFRFVVVEEGGALRAEQRGFRTLLWGGLGLLALLLVLLQHLLLRWGLAPLARLTGDINRIESGESRRLDGDYPTEVRALTAALNRLLEREQAQRERYRNTLADLAHSLKTPLAVIRNLEPGSRRELDEQLDRMEQIISHQLGRSVAVKARPVPAGRIAVRPAAERILAAMGKIYRARGIRFDLRGDCRFGGDERDLLELLGNLVDNACKYGHGRVVVTLAELDDGCEIRVADNGPGVAEAVAGQVLARGVRADELPRGQGIGLAVAADIAASYGGSLSVGSSAELGGAEFRVLLRAF